MTTDAQLRVALLDRLAVVKITGKANFTLSVDFKRVFAELAARGNTHVALELSGCPVMDSTFLGVLAGFALKASAQAPDCGQAMALIGANHRIQDMLDNLGVKHLFHFVDSSSAAPEAFTPVDCTGAAAPKLEVTRTCLEAHELLMAVNPANVSKFKDVTAFLAEDIKRLEGQKN